jgi:hypothetical protein
VYITGVGGQGLIAFPGQKEFLYADQMIEVFEEMKKEKLYD